MKTAEALALGITAIRQGSQTLMERAVLFPTIELTLELERRAEAVETLEHLASWPVEDCEDPWVCCIHQRPTDGGGSGEATDGR